MAAFERLSEAYDIIVIEGAGSPAEINLKENDIVNMGLAAMVDAPVILVGDIDRGGVFAALYGTVALLTPEERERIRGLVINKFRGDPAILAPGVRMIEELTGIPVVLSLIHIYLKNVFLRIFMNVALMMRDLGVFVQKGIWHYLADIRHRR